MVMNPCNCGGLPYLAHYYAPTDTYCEDRMFIIRCQLCGNVGDLEFKEDSALANWNKRNTNHTHQGLPRG